MVSNTLVVPGRSSLNPLDRRNSARRSSWAARSACWHAVQLDNQRTFGACRRSRPHRGRWVAVPGTHELRPAELCGAGKCLGRTFMAVDFGVAAQDAFANTTSLRVPLSGSAAVEPPVICSYPAPTRRFSNTSVPGAGPNPRPQERRRSSSARSACWPPSSSPAHAAKGVIVAAERPQVVDEGVG